MNECESNHYIKQAYNNIVLNSVNKKSHVSFVYLKIFINLHLIHVALCVVTGVSE